jgi:hypothetical protein
MKAEDRQEMLETLDLIEAELFHSAQPTKPRPSSA